MDDGELNWHLTIVMIRRHIMLLLSLAIFLFIFLPRLLTFGMFLDGSIYSSIARNMAEGAGSFWAPYYGGMGETVFYWHPPMAFKLHSYLYLIIGDYPFVDTLYGLIVAIASLLLIYKIHCLLAPQKSAWFSVLLFSIMPMVSWTLSNNMLEMTMTLFVLLSVYSQLWIMKNDNRWKYFLFFISGVSLSFAVLSKNVAGLFPLILPVLYSFSLDLKFRVKTFAYTFLHTLGVAAFFWAFVYLTGGADFFSRYLDLQVMGSLQGKMTGEDSDLLQKFGRLGSEAIVPLVVCLIAFFTQKRKFRPSFLPASVSMILLGLAGILPLFLVPKFRTFYMYPGLPFLALGLGILFSDTAELISQAMETIFYRLTAGLTIAFAVAGFAMMVMGSDKNPRGAEWKHDIHDTKPDIPPRTRIFFCNDRMLHDYTTVAYMQRYFKWIPGGRDSEFIFVDSKYPCKIPPECRIITPEKNKRFHLFRCTGE